MPTRRDEARKRRQAAGKGSRVAQSRREHEQRQPLDPSASAGEAMLSASIHESGIVPSLTDAIAVLFKQRYLAENPFAALVALLRHQPAGFANWGSRAMPWMTAPDGRRPAGGAPLRNEVNGVRNMQDPGHEKIRRAKDTFEWWGLRELVELVDPAAAKRTAALVEARHGVAGGRSTEGEYTVRHVLALSGDWVFAQRAIAFPGTLWA